MELTKISAPQPRPQPQSALVESPLADHILTIVSSAFNATSEAIRARCGLLRIDNLTHMMQASGDLPGPNQTVSIAP